MVPKTKKENIVENAPPRSASSSSMEYSMYCFLVAPSDFIFGKISKRSKIKLSKIVNKTVLSIKIIEIE